MPVIHSLLPSPSSLLNYPKIGISHWDKFCVGISPQKNTRNIGINTVSAKTPPSSFLPPPFSLLPSPSSLHSKNMCINIEILRSYECVRMLLDARGDVNHQDSFGYSPLHIAALNEYSYCASLLLSYGADVTIRTNGGTSALSMIVRKETSFQDHGKHIVLLFQTHRANIY